MIEALENRIVTGSKASQVWHSLVTDRGMTFEKLMVWKRKSFFLLAKSFYFKKDYSMSIPFFEAALVTFDSDPSAATTTSSTSSKTDYIRIKDMLATAKKYFQQERKKEKSTWSKAFKELENEFEGVETSVGNDDNDDNHDNKSNATTTSNTASSNSQMKPHDNNSNDDRQLNSPKSVASTIFNINNINALKKKSTTNNSSNKNNNNNNILTTLTFQQFLLGAGLFSVLGFLGFAVSVGFTRKQFR